MQTKCLALLSSCVQESKVEQGVDSKGFGYHCYSGLGKDEMLQKSTTCVFVDAAQAST